MSKIKGNTKEGWLKLATCARMETGNILYYSSEKHNHIVLACLREHKTKEITPCLLTREPNAIETFVRMIL
jgi:Fe2+ or Zn2+ uptake regulation protein